MVSRALEKNEFITKNDLNVLTFSYHPKYDTRIHLGFGPIPFIPTPGPQFPLKTTCGITGWGDECDTPIVP